MTKSKALNAFFNRFGTAYPSTAVPMDVEFPYITYENNIGNVGETRSCNMTLWYHTDSEAIPNNKADEIADVIGLGGLILSVDNGAIWVKRGTPWCQSINDANDSSIKGRLLTLELEYM